MDIWNGSGDGERGRNEVGMMGREVHADMEGR
jgi:hypothetical protein